MSGLHRICCCGAPPSCDDCTGCFGSSYIATGIGGVITWNKSDIGTLCESVCLNPEEANKTEYIVTLTVTQIGSWTMTRRTVGAACCYSGAGDLDVDYTIRIIRTARCCAQSPAVTLTKDDTYSGTQTVPACITVVPVCNTATGQCRFVHTLRICSFPVQNIEYMDEIDAGDCATGLEIGEEPLSRYGLWVSGACQTWETTHEALNLITGLDWSWQGWGCSAVDGGCDATCVQTFGNSTIPNGPFSLVFAPEWVSEPAECADVLAIANFIVGSWYDCGETPIKEADPYFSFDYQQDCCVGEGQGSISRPIYA